MKMFKAAIAATLLAASTLASAQLLLSTTILPTAPFEISTSYYAGRAPGFIVWNTNMGCTFFNGLVSLSTDPYHKEMFALVMAAKATGRNLTQTSSAISYPWAPAGSLCRINKLVL